MHKVALITGAGRRRVGWHVAQSLAERGYALVIHYHTSAAEAAETVAQLAGRGVEAIALGADLADEGQVRQLVAASLEWFGRINVLVNAAAIWKAKPLEQVTAADVRQNFEMNTLGTFLCCQHVGLAMACRAKGARSSTSAIGPKQGLT